MRKIVLCLVSALMCCLLVACDMPWVDNTKPSRGRAPQMDYSSSSSSEEQNFDESSFEESQGSAANMPPMDDGGFYDIKNDDGVYLCGSAIDIHGMRIAFLDYDPDWRDYDEWLAPETGYVYARAFFRFTSNSDVDMACGSSYFSCFADDVLCKEAFIGNIDDLTTYHLLAPGRSLDGWVYFKVPEKSKVIDLEYVVNETGVLERYQFTLDS